MKLLPRYRTAGHHPQDHVKAAQEKALERFAEVIRLHDENGLTFAQIAGQLDISRIRASHLYRRAHRCWSESIPFAVSR